MLKQFATIAKIGVVSEPAPASVDRAAAEFGISVRRVVDRVFSGSLHIRHVDAGSCNACELEIHALNNPYYAIERFGVHFVASPRHADVLLITGPVARHMETALRRCYAAMPTPCWVIASGTCACDGGEFGCSYASAGAVANVLPVDLEIPGCPPSPIQLMAGILRLADAA